MRKRISQKAARLAMKRRDELSTERHMTYGGWSRGSYIGTAVESLQMNRESMRLFRFARKMGFALVLVPADTGDVVDIFAVRG